MKRVLERKPANRVLRSGNNIRTNFSDTDRSEIGQYAVEYGNTVLVKIEGGANIGNAHLQR